MGNNIETCFGRPGGLRRYTRHIQLREYKGLSKVLRKMHIGSKQRKVGFEIEAVFFGLTQKYTRRNILKIRANVARSLCFKCEDVIIQCRSVDLVEIDASKKRGIFMSGKYCDGIQVFCNEELHRVFIDNFGEKMTSVTVRKLVKVRRAKCLTGVTNIQKLPVFSIAEPLTDVIEEKLSLTVLNEDSPTNVACEDEYSAKQNAAKKQYGTGDVTASSGVVTAPCEVHHPHEETISFHSEYHVVLEEIVQKTEQDTEMKRHGAGDVAASLGIVTVPCEVHHPYEETVSLQLDWHVELEETEHDTEKKQYDVVSDMAASSGAMTVICEVHNPQEEATSFQQECHLEMEETALFSDVQDANSNIDNNITELITNVLAQVANEVLLPRLRTDFNKGAQHKN